MVDVWWRPTPIHQERSVTGLASGQTTFSGQAYGAVILFKVKVSQAGKHPPRMCAYPLDLNMCNQEATKPTDFDSSRYSALGVQMQRVATLSLLVAAVSVAAWWFGAETIMVHLGQVRAMLWNGMQSAPPSLCLIRTLSTAKGLLPRKAHSSINHFQSARVSTFSPGFLACPTCCCLLAHHGTRAVPQDHTGNSTAALHICIEHVCIPVCLVCLPAQQQRSEGCRRQQNAGDDERQQVDEVQQLSEGCRRQQDAEDNERQQDTKVQQLSEGCRKKGKMQKMMGGSKIRRCSS
eukprot:1147222-Pelagomonas_calceolata.AAC.5